MKKIAMVLSTYPQEGGQFQYEALLAGILLKNAPERYELYAFCRNSYWVNWCRKNRVVFSCLNRTCCGQKEIRWNTVHPVVSGIYHRFFTPEGKLLRESRFDLLINGQQGNFLPNYFIKEIRPVHDLMHRYEGRFPEIGSTYRERELLFQNVARNTSVILTDSVLGKRQFQESYLKQKGRRPKIKVLPYIVPEHVLKEQEEQTAVPEKYVFYPAQFWSHKNHINLVKAIRLLKEEIPDICLVLTGSEKNSMNQVKEYAAANGLKKQLLLKGFVSDGVITYLYKHAVCLVMPTYFGPTNIPPLEAMALGCPVAVSNKYAMPQQVGKAGLLFDPDSPEEIADCIRRIWTDEPLRRRMVKEGYRQIRRWTPDDFERTFMEIILEEL